MMMASLETLHANDLRGQLTINLLLLPLLLHSYTLYMEILKFSLGRERLPVIILPRSIKIRYLFFSPSLKNLLSTGGYLFTDSGQF